jgi:hypothetical protein
MMRDQGIDMCLSGRKPSGLVRRTEPPIASRQHRRYLRNELPSRKPRLAGWQNRAASRHKIDQWPLEDDT